MRRDEKRYIALWTLSPKLGYRWEQQDIQWYRPEKEWLRIVTVVIFLCDTNRDEHHLYIFLYFIIFPYF